jgi:hypothetical protein
MTIEILKKGMLIIEQSAKNYYVELNSILALYGVSCELYTPFNAVMLDFFSEETLSKYRSDPINLGHKQWIMDLFEALSIEIKSSVPGQDLAPLLAKEEAGLQTILQSSKHYDCFKFLAQRYYALQIALLNCKLARPLLASLLCVESPMLEYYEANYSSHFGSIVQLLTIPPVTLADEAAFNRWFYFDGDLRLACEFMKQVVRIISSVIAAVSSQDGPSYIRGMREATELLTTRYSVFFPVKNKAIEPQAMNSQKITLI